MTEILRDDFDIELKVPASLHAFISERGALFQKLRLDYFVNVRHGSSSRRAQRLNKGRLNIPLSVVRPATEDEKKQKYKVTILEVGEPAKEGEEGDIPWRLKYEPIDVEDLLNDLVTRNQNLRRLTIKRRKRLWIRYPNSSTTRLHVFQR